MRRKPRIKKINRRLKDLLEASETPRALRLYAGELQSVAALLVDAAAERRPAEYLYLHDARTRFFMLQGLARIHERTIGKDNFRHLRGDFKAIEDMLGGVDYFDLYRRVARENFPLGNIPGYFEERYRTVLRDLEAMLRTAGWIDPGRRTVRFPRMKKTLRRLQDVKWKKLTGEREAVIDLMSSRLEKISTAVKNGEYDFQDLEHGIHEFRRNIRWISIYAQALGGLIQYRNGADPDPGLARYCTADVIELPYNRLPPLRDRIRPIFVSPTIFQALSSCIARLGTLKDQGQLREAFVVALDDMSSVSTALKDDVMERIDRLTPSESEIQRQVRELIEAYVIEHRGLDRLAADLRNN